jgi:hypothetical protein
MRLNGLVVEEHTFVQSSLEMREKRSTWQASTMSEGMRSMPLDFRPFHACSPERSSVYVPSSRCLLRVSRRLMLGIVLHAHPCGGFKASALVPNHSASSQGANDFGRPSPAPRAATSQAVDYISTA